MVPGLLRVCLPVTAFEDHLFDLFNASPDCYLPSSHPCWRCPGALQNWVGYVAACAEKAGA